MFPERICSVHHYKVFTCDVSMNVYTYHYDCKSWYGTIRGTRNIYLEGGEVHPEEAVRKDAQIVSGSNDCNIRLIQKYTMTITDVETYPAMASLPLHKYTATST